jgi:hypothetical protein
MLDGVVKHNSPIVMRPPFRDVAREQQGRAHEPMPDHERNSRSSFLSKRQEPRCDIATRIAVERY